MRGGGIGPAGLTRDPRARKTDDRQTTVAVGPAGGGGGGVCVCAYVYIIYIYIYIYILYAMPVGVWEKRVL